MKHFKSSVLALSILSMASTAYAVPTLPPEVNDDLDFPNGVLIENVTLPSDLNVATGSSYANVDGTGTVIIGNQAAGGFPKLRIFGGTTITSTRTWGEDANKTWWEGQLESPGSIMNPNANNIEFFSERNSTLEPIRTYQFGQNNETFSYSVPIQIYTQVDEVNGAKLWLAFLMNGGQWTITENSFCIVEDGICAFETANVNAVAIIKEIYAECPITSIQNGTVNPAPLCDIKCNDGFALNADGSACVPFDSAGAGGSAPTGANTGGNGMNNTLGAIGQMQDTPTEVLWRPGYFRYRASGDQLEGRYVRTREEQLKTNFFHPNGIAGNVMDKDAYLGYMNEMRNKFTKCNGGNCIEDPAEIESLANGQEEVEVVVSADTSPATEIATVTEAGDESKTLTAMTNTPPLLPTTGPGLFAGIAAFGIGLMIFGARRHN